MKDAGESIVQELSGALSRIEECVVLFFFGGVELTFHGRQVVH